MDLAYLKFTPNPDLTLIGGRVHEPVASLPTSSGGTRSHFRRTRARTIGELSDLFQPFFTGGAFPLQQAVLSTDDKYLFAGQAGLDINPQKNLSGKLGVAFYDFVHTRGIANNPAIPTSTTGPPPPSSRRETPYSISSPPGSPPSSRWPRTTTSSTSPAEFDIAFWKPIHVILTGDYVNNLGFRPAVRGAPHRQAEVPTQTQGYFAGLTVGYPEIKNRWDWRVFGYYKYLEADAVIDAFTDPDFHSGRDERQGLGASEADLGVGKNLWTSVKWTTANEIKGPPFAIDSLFVDLNYRF